MGNRSSKKKNRNDTQQCRNVTAERKTENGSPNKEERSFGSEEVSNSLMHEDERVFGSEEVSNSLMHGERGFGSEEVSSSFTHEEERSFDSEEVSSSFTHEEERGFGSEKANSGLVHEEERSLGSEEISISGTAEKCYDDSTLTYVEGDDVLDFLCNDFKSLRAKMSCGHAVTPMSLTNWCRRLLEKGECRFVCALPQCDAEWPFEEVCKMALLTPEERDYFERKIFSNASKTFLDVKVCPGCQSRVMRANLHDLSVQCPVCTARRGRVYRFCWQCLKKWKGPAPRSDRCGNADCQDPLEILRNCPDITFKDVEGVTGCPSIRACPTCGFLVEHDRTLCKNVYCVRCKVEFCFVCLKLTKECADVKNASSYFELCSSGVAPRQTSLPVWQRT